MHTCDVVAAQTKFEWCVNVVGWQIEVKDGSGGNGEKTLVFYKIRPEVITPDNMHTIVFVSSVLDSPVSTLYQSVHHVFMPMLLKNDQSTKGLDPKLQSLLGELDAGLGSVLRKGSDTSAPARGAAVDDNVGGEWAYWHWCCCNSNNFNIGTVSVFGAVIIAQSLPECSQFMWWM